MFCRRTSLTTATCYTLSPFCALICHRSFLFNASCIEKVVDHNNHCGAINTVFHHLAPYRWLKSQLKCIQSPFKCIQSPFLDVSCLNFWKIFAREKQAEQPVQDIIQKSYLPIWASTVIWGAWLPLRVRIISLHLYIGLLSRSALFITLHKQRTLFVNVCSMGPDSLSHFPLQLIKCPICHRKIIMSLFLGCSTVNFKHGHYIVGSHSYFYTEVRTKEKTMASPRAEIYAKHTPRNLPRI